MDFDTI